MMENKIRVLPIGIDPRTTATLDLAFKGLGKGQLELTEDLKADVVLFDGDAVEAKSRFNQFVQNNAEMPLLVMSVRPENWSSNAQTISKPLDVNSLFKKIKSLLKKMSRRVQILLQNLHSLFVSLLRNKLWHQRLRLRRPMLLKQQYLRL